MQLDSHRLLALFAAATVRRRLLILCIHIQFLLFIDVGISPLMNYPIQELSASILKMFMICQLFQFRTNKFYDQL